MTRTGFQQELKGLHEQILKMEASIERSGEMMITALEQMDHSVAQEVIDRDDIVDEMEAEIESLCIDLITRQQPVASDLREITSVLKMITDLERISDQCADICEYILKMDRAKGTACPPELIQMAKQVKVMFTQMMDSYVNQNSEQAIATAKSDDQVDDYFQQITKLVTDRITQNPDFVPNGVALLFIGKYLERIADHITNVCEWIAYRVTGAHTLFN